MPLPHIQFPPTFFAIPLGLAGLAGVWHLMAGFYGFPGAVPDVLFVVAATLWLLLAVDAIRWLICEPRAIRAELRDPVLSPFWSLPLIVGMVLPIGLQPYAPGAAKVAFVVFLAATIAFGGLITGEWIIMEPDPRKLHPGYVLPTVAGSLVAAGGAGGFGLHGLGWLSFGIGIVSWLVLSSLTFNRLFLVPALPDALVPSVIFEAAPAALAGTAYFELHGPVPDPVAYGLTGYLVLLVLVQVRLLPVFRRLTFTPGFWSFTFPWSVIASFTLTWLHIERPPGQMVYAALVLAAVTLLIGAIAVRSLVAVASGEFLAGPDAAPPVPGLGLPSFQRRPGGVDRLTSGRPAPNGTRSADPAPRCRTYR